MLCSGDQDTITSSESLKDSQSVVSKNGTFRLGFFSPEANSTDRYLGIWFNKAPITTVVWVANRNRPVKDKSGVLKISDKGNLLLLNGQNQTIWSSNVSNTTATSPTAQLLDSGNLVLLQNSSLSLKHNIIWQSFDHPSNTLLPGMQPTVANTANKENFIFRSWRTPSDPSEGIFSVGIGTIGIPQVFTWRNGVNYWRSGPWDGNNFIGLANIDATMNDGFILEDHPQSGTIDMLFPPQDVSILLNYVIDPDGIIKEQYWDKPSESWKVGFSEPQTECDVYGKCGTFGTCNVGHSPICRCLRGFQPKNEAEWKKGNWSRGCVRSKQLQCGNAQGGKQDGFLRLPKVKVPDNIEKVTAFNQDNCRTKCLNNCSCIAYAYRLNIGCMMWTKDLVDIQEFTVGGVDLFLRLASSELEGKAHKKTEIIAIVTVAGTLVVAILLCFLWRWITRQGKRVERLDHEDKYRDNVVQIELQKPPLYTFEMLRNATNNFQDSNKLGEGGFGLVYKGILEDGQVVAVKRLSRASQQGLQEFMNEVEVISKLQHRNLVRLLGCCIEEDEKMLVYEYMSNKSLDAFLFDPPNEEHLCWEKRHNIIGGICRGLLYLHRDSRLKIIHRDLKTSNILLDEDFNSKISDFGMARIFGGNQDEANTRRVVGTYGYMSPEYTMGQFSEKSDVYSFGVILLEIISGKSTTSFNFKEHSYTLLGYAWKLWNEGKIESLIDPMVSQPTFPAEILRCIQVALLCVQELPSDRPNISTVISMLDNDIKHLQQPKKPPFTEWEISSIDQQSKSISTADYSISIIEGR